MPDKVSLKALRELHAEYARINCNGQRRDQERADVMRFDMADAIPAVLPSVEALRLARPYVYCSSLCDKSLTGDACSCGAETVGAVMDAALALVEE